MPGTARVEQGRNILRTVFAASALVLILRGLRFIPLSLWNPSLLARICDCQRVDFYIFVTSLLCLAMGIGLGLGAVYARVENRAHSEA